MVNRSFPTGFQAAFFAGQSADMATFALPAPRRNLINLLI
jgi:hypothetical protein